MATDSKHQQRTRIASAVMPNIGTVFIYYIGGSTCELDVNAKSQSNFPSQKKDQNVRFNISVLDKLVQKRQARILSQTKYNEIKSKILPDGSTPTHNADGSMKSKLNQTFNQLVNDDIIQRESNGHYAINPGDSSNDFFSPSQIDDDIHQTEAAGHDDMATNSHDDDDKEDPFDDLFGDNEKIASSSTTSIPASPRNHDGQTHANDNHDEDDPDGDDGLKDLNGDGVIDEFDELIEKSKKPNVFLIILLSATLVISVVLFFVIHAVSESIASGTPPERVFSISGDNPSGNNASSNASTTIDGNPTRNAERSSSSARRSDYDPDSSVMNYHESSEPHREIAIKMFQQIRKFIYDGDVNQFSEAIDLNSIGNQLASSYVAIASSTQKLSAPEAQDTQSYYSEAFVQREKQHVVDKDPYGSIFGGRIRDVRDDPDNPNRMYVVMESIAGDHQRCCFVLDGDDDGNWEISGMMDVDGYIRMISS